MRVLSRQEMFEADDWKKETVFIPEWGGDVIVQTISARKKDAWELSITNMPGEKRKDMSKLNVRASLCVKCIVGEDGKRIFTDEDAARLGQKSAVAIDRIFDVARKLNGINDTDLAELEKNSETDQSDSSNLD